MSARIVKWLVPLSLNLAIMSLCLFGSPGGLDWSNGWDLVGLSFAASVAATAVVWRNPELARERRNIKAGKSWDKLIVGIVVLLGPVATWITAGLDARYHWSDSIPLWGSIAGAAIAVLGAILMAWAMQSNEFFSAVVRIQKDRGHTVVTGGPYRFIRHPGYAGMSAFMLATPLILNSRWAFAPAVVTTGVSVRRTALEDCTLQSELEGYADYARNVRSRLLPAVW
jgi:protein-S-isoprenylcysteine O-methyltransferase Ste14